ncbi:MAG: sugar phosphate isomerase/epimerase family protein, partial [Solirubrobacteraceae bacterium]
MNERAAMRLAFTTLGCPEWSLERVVEAVREYGYDGVELRLVDGEVLPPDPPAGIRQRLRTALRGVAVAAVDTSLRMAQAEDGWEEDLRGYCEVAHELGSDLVRVFGGTPEAGSEDPDAGIIARLGRAARIAGPYGVRVALETHDELSSARRVAPVLASVPDPALGVL